jgi:hypothetical protein
MSFNLSSTPFSSTSAWNQQVNTGATYTSLNWPTSTGWNYDVGWGNVPVYVASSSDPVVQVSVPASWGWPGGTVSVHVPAGATGGTPTDSSIVIIDGDTVYNFWRFNRTSNTTATAQSYGETNAVTDTGWGSSGIGAGILAVGASELGGMLIKAQTDSGTIDHALQLAVDGSLLKSGYVSPAIATDGSSSSGIMQEGQHLAIAPGTPMPSGLSALGQEVFRALQQYGAYVIDSGGTQTSIRTQANAYDAATMNALRLDMNSVLPMLKAVSGGTPTPSGGTGTPTVTPAVTQAIASPATGIEQAGDTITLSLGFNEAVTVTGTPTLSLNDGNKATYAGGSGTSTLTFKTTVAATDTNTSALAITGVNLPSGSSIKDASGVAANLSGAVKTFSGLQIDPILPAVTQASASPATGTALVGDTVTLSLGFNEAVTVTGTPTLSLNDGGTATYVGGSGTGTLTFKTTVASTDTTTSALAITGVNLSSGASIKDASGVAANLSGAVKTFTGLAIDPPPVSPPISPAVTQATASPGTGTEHVGNTITLSLGFNEAVTVTGTPTLTLNDGGTATYVGGSGTGTLTFNTTVASTNTSTSALAITGVNLPSGATIKDASGVAANLAGAVKTFSGLQVVPTSSTPTTPTTPSATKPVLTIADHSLSVAGRGGTVDLGTKVTTTDSNDVVTVNITGLPKYETITDKLDGQTFRGNNITLTAAQVDSGLELQSNYRGGGHPTATLTLTASAKDPSTGAVSTASPQTITVVDPRPTAVATSTSSHHHHHHHHHHIATDHQPAATTTAVAPTSPQTIDRADHPQATAANTGDLASRGFALLQQHFDPATSALATTAPQSITAGDHPVATGMASFASQSFALLNQYLAGHAGQVDAGQIVAAVSHAIGLGQESLLARPQH